MKKCKICENGLTHRIEKGFIEEYDYIEDEGIDNDSLRSDCVIDIREYDYCSACDTFFYDLSDNIIDGRNSFEFNMNVFDDIFIMNFEEDNLSDALQAIDFINMNGYELSVLLKNIENKYKEFDSKDHLDEVMNSIQLCEILIEDTRIINYEGLENKDDLDELSKTIKEILGSQYQVKGFKYHSRYEVGIFDIVNNNELLFSIKGIFFFDYFLYGYWKAAVERTIEQLKFKRDLLKAI